MGKKPEKIEEISGLETKEDSPYTGSAMPVTKNDFKILLKDFFGFFGKNEIMRNIGLVFLAGGVMYVLVTFLNIRAVTIISYLLGLGLMGFLVYYSYRDWAKNREHYVSLENRFDGMLDELVEEDLEAEIPELKNKKREKNKNAKTKED